MTEVSRLGSQDRTDGLKNTMAMVLGMQTDGPPEPILEIKTMQTSASVAPAAATCEDVVSLNAMPAGGSTSCQSSYNLVDETKLSHLSWASCVDGLRTCVHCMQILLGLMSLIHE